MKLVKLLVCMFLMSGTGLLLGSEIVLSSMTGPGFNEDFIALIEKARDEWKPNMLFSDEDKELNMIVSYTMSESIINMGELIRSPRLVTDIKDKMKVAKAIAHHLETENEPQLLHTFVCFDFVGLTLILKTIKRVDVEN